MSKLNVITDEQINAVLNEQMSYLKDVYEEKQCLGLFTYGKTSLLKISANCSCIITPKLSF